MKPVDGQHRRHDPDDHSAWCRRLFDMLVDGGKWGVPRSGLTFTRRGDTFVLTDRAAHHEGLAWLLYQQGDYLNIKQKFEAAGIAVSDETIPVVDGEDEESR